MSANLTTQHHFWNKKIRLPQVLFILTLGILSVAFAQYAMMKPGAVEPPQAVVQPDNCPPPPVIRYRMKDYAFTHPLLLTDRLEESKDLAGLKNEIALMVQNWKSSGQILSASVYIRVLDDNRWTAINADEGYNPGSLIKVPIMMTYLREAEKNPGLLEKKLTLNPSAKVPLQTYTGDRIVAGKAYTIKELIYYMIVKSDNYATALLNNNVNIPEFKKLFVDLGMPEPDVHSTDFRITAADYSKFFRILYNATYISNEDADFALTLLTQSDFNEGMKKFLPANIKVAHKFGEWGDPHDQAKHQLSEAGIIFYNDNPLLITVMTRGTEVKLLPEVISSISKRVFDRMTGENRKS